MGWGWSEVRRQAPGSPTHGHPSQPPSGASGLAWGTEVGRGPADGPRLHYRVNVGYGQAESQARERGSSGRTSRRYWQMNFQILTLYASSKYP